MIFDGPQISSCFALLMHPLHLPTNHRNSQDFDLSGCNQGQENEYGMQSDLLEVFEDEDNKKYL
jgi:hypothetical protein